MIRSIVLIVMSASLLLVPSGSTASEKAGQAPMIVSGRLAGALAKVQVTATLEPGEEQMADLEDGGRVIGFTLPEDSIQVRRSVFSVHVRPESVPANYVDSSGRVHIRIDALTDAGQVASSAASARFVRRDGSQAWVDPMVNPAAGGEASMTEPRAMAEAESPSTGTADPITADLTFSRPNPRVSRALRSSTSAYASVLTPAFAACAVTRIGPSRDRWATIGSSYPRGKVSSYLTYSSSTSSTFGIAISYNKGGDYSASGSRNTTDSWGQNFNKRRINRVFRTEVRYRRLRCFHSSGIELYRQWKPVRQNGYTKVLTGISSPGWNRHCGPVAGGDWYRGRARGRDYSLSTGVKIADQVGINLSSRRSYGGGSRLYYNHSRRKMLCGSNGEAGYASKVRFKKFP